MIIAHLEQVGKRTKVKKWDGMGERRGSNRLAGTLWVSNLYLLLLSPRWEQFSTAISPRLATATEKPIKVTGQRVTTERSIKYTQPA